MYMMLQSLYHVQAPCIYHSFIKKDLLQNCLLVVFTMSKESQALSSLGFSFAVLIV